MEVIGLTGGIASGKSTVRAILERLGAAVLDADATYHDLITPIAGQPSPLASAIAARFPGVLLPSGEIDRKKLGQQVFSDAAARDELGRITHPAVALESARRIADLFTRGISRVVYDVPLLYERGLEKGMRGVIVVWVPREVQLARLMHRDGLSRDAALQRLASQLALDEKKERATWVVDNSGRLADLEARVVGVWREITGA
jgi:dephospho-CoA kinase